MEQGELTGEPVVVLADGAVVVLPEGSETHLTTRLRAALLQPNPLFGIVAALTEARRSGLPSLCAAVVGEDGCRVIVRGDGRAVAVSATGEAVTVAAAAGVTTWREEFLDSPASVILQSARGACPPIELVLAPGVASAPILKTEADEPPASSSAEPPASLSDDQSTSDEELAADNELMVAEPEERQDPNLTLAPPNDIDEMASAPPPEPSPLKIAPPTGDEQEFDFSHLLEETQFRGVEEAAVREVEPPSGAEHGPMASPTPPPSTIPPPTPLAPQLPEPPDRLIEHIPGAKEPGPVEPIQAGDHDGHTIAAGALRDLLRSMPSPEGAPRVAGPAVQAVFCAGAHPNSPHSGRCRFCGGPIADRTVRTIPRPVLGRLRFSTGVNVELDRPQLIGRRPTMTGPPTGDPPGLVTVPDPDQSLSRVHVEVRLEGWEVFVVDLGSTNGTIVEIPGQAPTRLRAGEPCLVVPGTAVTLADVAGFVFEVAP